MLVCIHANDGKKIIYSIYKRQSRFKKNASEQKKRFNTPRTLCQDIWSFGSCQYRSPNKMAMKRVRAIAALKRILLLLRIKNSRRTKVNKATTPEPFSDSTALASNFFGISGVDNAGTAASNCSTFCLACCLSSSSPASVATQRMKKSGGLSS